MPERECDEDEEGVRLREGGTGLDTRDVGGWSGLLGGSEIRSPP